MDSWWRGLPARAWTTSVRGDGRTAGRMPTAPWEASPQAVRRVQRQRQGQRQGQRQRQRQGQRTASCSRRPRFPVTAPGHGHGSRTRTRLSRIPRTRCLPRPRLRWILGGVGFQPAHGPPAFGETVARRAGCPPHHGKHRHRRSVGSSGSDRVSVRGSGSVGDRDGHGFRSRPPATGAAPGHGRSRFGESSRGASQCPVPLGAVGGSSSLLGLRFTGDPGGASGPGVPVPA
jgi:hypothetical protein